MAKKNSDLYATSTIGAAGIIGMLFMMVFANGFSFSLGGYDLSGQAIAGIAEKTPYDAGLEVGYTQCLKDDGKYTEKQAVKKMDTGAMRNTVSSLVGYAVASSCADSDKDVQGGTTVPVKGFVTADGKTSYDLCKDKYTITEYYCTTDGKAASYPLTCPAGTMCKDALCVATDSTSTSQGITTGQQTGTTQQGTASGAQQSGQQTNQNTQISEEEKKKAEEEYKKGYEDGYKKCLDEKKVAITSTTQNTQTSQGTVSGAGQTSGQQTGTASGQQAGQTGQQTGTTQQGIASGVTQTQEQAGTSQTTQALCTDSDGGIEPAVYGEVYETLPNVIHTDQCSTTNEGYPYLAEMYCEGDTVKYAVVDCAELGLVCVDGACVSNT